MQIKKGGVLSEGKGELARQSNLSLRRFARGEEKEVGSGGDQEKSKLYGGQFALGAFRKPWNRRVRRNGAKEGIPGKTSTENSTFYPFGTPHPRKRGVGIL